MGVDRYNNRVVKVMLLLECNLGGSILLSKCW